MRLRSCDSPLGTLTLCEEEGKLSALLFSDGGKREESPLLLAAERQLCEYFSGARRAFDLPLILDGSAFARSVFSALCTVGYGECITYGSLAALSGFPRAARAVGNVLHGNPLPIFVPCHRVVGANGLGNFAWGMEKKLFLMRLEGVRV